MPATQRLKQKLTGPVIVKEKAHSSAADRGWSQFYYKGRKSKSEKLPRNFVSVIYAEAVCRPCNLANSPWGARDCSGNPAGLAKQARGIGAESPVFLRLRRKKMRSNSALHTPHLTFFSLP
jgi:hypothetical protein